MLYYLYFKSNNNNTFRIQPNADSAADVDGLVLEIFKKMLLFFYVIVVNVDYGFIVMQIQK